MKLLKIRASGIPLFKDTCEIDFLALQRVTADDAESMSTVFSTGNQAFTQNNVLALIGINASGKTTVLKLITFVCRMLNHEPLNSIDCAEFLDGLTEDQRVTIETYFYANSSATFPPAGGNAINLLKTVISKKNDKLFIVHETLKTKVISADLRKKNVLDFKGVEINFARHFNEYLLDDVSIMVAFNKRNNEQIVVSDMLQYTNINQLSLSDDCPLELIAFFDPSIEYLRFKKDSKDIRISLKFKGKKEITLNQFSELNRYLSSGTIKGINTFLKAIKVFKAGGYLIVDELENHFNREIVSTLIHLFMDKRVNKSGAMLIFSTHYAELLDEFERNDNIYIVRNRHGIILDNLSTILNRNDIKKSDAYQSGFLEGTVPMYEAYMDLKRALIKANEEG